MATPSAEMMPKMSAAIAALSMDAVQKANSGHPGMPMGMADVATVLFSNFLKFDAKLPRWADRDRFILSAGHGSMLLYALAYLTGYDDMSLDDIKNFRQLGSKTAGHPEYGHVDAAETTTGPLGQGIANSVGFAMAEAHLAARHGADIVDHYTYVIAGDGCLMEGLSQEAIGLAGHLQLRKLIVLWDDNDITIDGAVSLSDRTDQRARFEASGWETMACDGHDMAAIDRAITAAQKSDKPTLIACKTIIGKGAGAKAGTNKAHGAPLGEEAIANVRDSLDWPHAPFEVPDDILAAWRAVGSHGSSARAEWQRRLQASSQSDEFSAAIKGDFSSGLKQAFSAYKAKLFADPVKVATRKASEMALEVINTVVPITIGGSADLTGSNNTLTKDLGIFSAADYAGRYVYWGIREHGMAAAMNGLALHGGVIPYGGTFFCFTDYCRPSMRLAALMGVRSIYVMTHDSIGLGEDGPTHQPVEHLAACRAIPNLYNFRPCDVVETAECWQLALGMESNPSNLVLTRQGLPQLRRAGDDNICAHGGYILAEYETYDVTLIASGSEVSLAIEAQSQLKAQNIQARVVSMPCLDLFLEQTEDYQRQILGDKPRVAIEAGIRMGWDRVLYSFDNTKVDFVGMESFGASAPAPDLFKHFGITATNICAKVKALLS